MELQLLAAILFVIVFKGVIIHSSHDEKRLLLSDPTYIQQQLQSLQTEIQDLKTKQSQYENTISDLQGQLSKTVKANGPVYTRWGKKTCSNNASLVYTGYTAGSDYTHSGSSALSVCLPQDPLWSSSEPNAARGESKIYGSEYEYTLGSQNLVNEDIPCAVCMGQSGSDILMIPGRNRCYKDWKEEYNGYLVGPPPDQHALDYICIDNHPDSVYGGAADTNGRVFYFARAQCGTLKCPPYENKIVTCVVCSK